LGKADLHTHTDASDGDCSAEFLLKRAKQKGLRTLAITDHDTIRGYLKAVEIADDIGIELIPGVEISCLWNNREVHILAYSFDTEDEEIESLLRRQSLARKARMRAIVKKLQDQGVDLDYEEVQAEAYGGNIGRPHAAHVLMKKQYVRSFPEAFVRYLGKPEIKNIETGYAEISEVLSVVKGAGGVLSVAHPGPMYTDTEIEDLLSTGIDGIECIHPSHNFDKQKKYTEMAKSAQLLVTGGSDYHGRSKSEYDPYFGTVTIGEQHVSALLRTSENRKRIRKDLR
jgi:predicted metal-dependent phosphoesterase TrpH